MILLLSVAHYFMALLKRIKPENNKSVRYKIKNMNTKQIMKVINNRSLPDSFKNADYLETQNAWVIRADHHAFKIRKPQQASGDELKDAESRKEVCYKELLLNKLLAGKFYEDVIPVKNMSVNTTGRHDNDEVVDYALKMKRFDESKKLSEFLKTGNITGEMVKDISKMLVRFHQKAKIIKNSFNISRFQNVFEEIKRCGQFAGELLGSHYERIISESISASEAFLTRNSYQIHQRNISGFIRDGHGDLSAEKIFLYNIPVIVDRVVMNDEQRQMDVLFDIARLGVDLDYFGFRNYDELLLNTYLQWSGNNLNLKNGQLYIYYKLYRVNMLITNVLDETTIFLVSEREKEQLLSYFSLLINYMHELQKPSTAILAE